MFASTADVPRLGHPTPRSAEHAAGVGSLGEGRYRAKNSPRTGASVSGATSWNSTLNPPSARAGRQTAPSRSASADRLEVVVGHVLGDVPAEFRRLHIGAAEVQAR